MSRIRSTLRPQSDCSTAYALTPQHEAPLLLWARLRTRRGRGQPLSAVELLRVQEVERVIDGESFSPRLRQLLQEWYVVRAHPGRTCARLGLRLEDHAQWLWRAVQHYHQQRVQPARAVHQANA